MTDLLSINTVAARLGLSVHQLRRWELMFGLEIKRGRGQQRQYRPEDMTVLERIKELVEQGWPTSQIRPQLEAEGLITPKLIGMPQPPGNPEMLMEALIGFRSFAERRFIELSKQIDELRQLMISITLKQELKGEISSPWQPLEEEFEPPAPVLPAQEISIGPAVSSTPTVITQSPTPTTPPVMPPSAAAGGGGLGLGEVTDQNYLDILGRALDLVNWSDDRADEYSQKTFGVAHWDELGRSQAEKLIAVLEAEASAGQQSEEAAV
jgi:DNA-binding transcriptional MerR regulator